MVRIKGLTSKPELNGCRGFVDAFLPESERYRVVVPGVPKQADNTHSVMASVLALKPENLDMAASGTASPSGPMSNDLKHRDAFEPPARAAVITTDLMSRIAVAEDDGVSPSGEHLDLMGRIAVAEQDANEPEHRRGHCATTTHEATIRSDAPQATPSRRSGWSQWCKERGAEV